MTFLVVTVVVDVDGCRAAVVVVVVVVVINTLAVCHCDLQVGIL